MTVYVDEAIWVWEGRKWCHLMADDLAELHRFAVGLGLKMSSYQGPPKTSAPHYDITGFERDRAIRLGAVPIGRRQVVELFRAQRSPRSELAPRRKASPRAAAAGRG